MDEFVATVVAALSDTTAEPIAQPVNPYKGLRAFDEPDAADFFGRERLVDDLVARLTEGGLAGRLVLVVGGSGSGKSSLVRAGLLPRLRSGTAVGAAGWFVATMVPGHSPFKELAESLRRVAVVGGDGLAAELADGTQGIDRVIRRVVPAGGDLLLVVDQLEELFTLVDKGEQRVFLDGLVHAVTAPASRLRVVATLRADFYDRPLRFERFASAIANSTVPIAAMSAAELDAAIVGPAERVGGGVEPALAAELVGAVLHEPAALPSLQFTLYELAARSPSGQLTLAGYRALGGVDAAIAARAEELYTGLDDPAREGIRRLFERLVVVSADGEPTRRRALRSELAVAAGPAGVEILPVIEAWAQSRLLTLDHHPETREPTVEVAHEALLREWPRLRGWLGEDREAIVALGHLREAAASWLALERDPGALYRGARLDVALQLAQDGARNLPAPEREFVEASLAERERERQHELEQLEHTVRANRRLRVQLAALAVALVAALVIGAVAVTQRNEASQERQTATARELAAAANANLEIDPERSVLLALAAVDRARPVGGSALRQAEQALHEAVYASRIEQRVDGVGGAVAWSPGGDRFAASTADGVVEIRDRATAEVVQTIDAHDDRVNGIAFSPDGALLGTTSEDDTAALWDLASGQLLHRFERPDTDLGDNSLVPSFSPDGTRFAFSWWTFDPVVWVVDVASGQVVQEIPHEFGNPASTSFDPTGTMMAVADGGVVNVFDVASGALRLTLEPIDGATYAAWSPDGESIALTTGTGVYVFDARTGEELFSLPDIVGTVDVDWSADSTDSTRLATANRVGTITVWRIVGRGALEFSTLSSQATRAGVADMAFSPDGLALVAGAVDYQTTLVWDTSLAASAEVANLPGPLLFCCSAADFTPDGRYVITGSPTGVLTVWDAQTYKPLRTLGGPDPRPGAVATAQEMAEAPLAPLLPYDVFEIEVSPDGSRVAALVRDKAAEGGEAKLRVWDVDSWEEPFQRTDEGWVDSMAWAPDGEHLALALTEPCCEPDATGPRNGVLRVLDGAGRLVKEVRDEEDWVHVLSLGFTPDGAQLFGARSPTSASAAFFGTATIWDWRAGTVDRTIDTDDYSVVLSPDGELLVSLPSSWLPSDLGAPVIDVWDFATGEHVRSLAGHSANVVAAAFSPDGARLASGGADGSVRIWNVSTGEQELVLPGHARSVSWLAFSPDGTELMSTSEDGFVRVWALDIDELVDIATRELTRNFTDDECRQYLHTERCPSS